MKTLRLRMIEKVPTRDAANRDVLLTIPTAAEWRAYNESIAKADFVLIWDGTEAALGALDAKQRKMFYDRLDAHRELEGKASDPLDGESLADFNKRLAAEDAERAKSTNEANKSYWDERLNR